MPNASWPWVRSKAIEFTDAKCFMAIELTHLTWVVQDARHFMALGAKKRIEAKLPLPAWATQPKLITHMRKLERRRGSEVFDTTNITVDLDAIFTPPSRKRKFSSEPNSKAKRRKYNFYFC